jgi:RNA polymerase sigma factor (sigma-70 family)
MMAPQDHDHIVLPMTLQSPKQPSNESGAPTSTRQLVDAGSRAARISADDERQLACRLADCRRELLAVSLLDRETAIELSRVATELTSGVRRIDEFVESAAASPTDAELEFRRFVDRAQALQKEVRLMLGASHDHSAFSVLEDEALDSASRRMLELVEALSPTSELTERLLQASWTARRDPHHDGVDLPPALRARVCRLDGEVEAIRSHFVQANQGLVAFVVQRYCGMGLRREDLMQEGNIGLLRAIEKFDPRRGTRFSVYAVWWIRQAARRALANQSQTIRIPVHALAARYAVDQASRRLALELGREPSEQDLASASGVGPNDVARARGMVKQPLSLSAPRGPESEACLGDSVEDRAAINPDEHAGRNERADRLHDLLDGLSSREREMLRMRFGLDGASECTLDQIGRRFALTRERVRQIVAAALVKLQHQAQVRRLELEP